MAELETIKEGWLSRSIEEARHSIHFRFTPESYANWQRFRGTSPHIKLPISNADADELYRRLDAQFRAWTLRGLAGYSLPKKEASHD